MVSSVWASCKHSEEKVNNQICFISDDLNPLSQKFFLDLAEYICLEIEQEKKLPPFHQIGGRDEKAEVSVETAA
jgi:hypothetical protein